jgi:hypothetical protein
MTRTMYDSTTAADIPSSATMVGGYVSPSSYAWDASDWARFPHAVQIHITPSASHTGVGVHVLDVERGDATPAQAPGWARAQRALGQDPTIYCGEAAWQSVQDAFASAGEPQPHYWVAAYPGTGPNLPTLNGITAVAHQYADSKTSGGHFDLSVVADAWPGVDTNASEVDLTPDEHNALMQILNQVANAWPQLGNKTLVDALSVIGHNQDSYHTDLSGRVAAVGTAVAGVATAVSKLPTTSATVTVDASTLQAALSAAGLSKDSIAQATAALFAQKLGA